VGALGVFDNEWVVECHGGGNVGPWDWGEVGVLLFFFGVWDVAFVDVSCQFLLWGFVGGMRGAEPRRRDELWSPGTSTLST
jgi:hypothetical protein